MTVRTQGIRLVMSLLAGLLVLPTVTYAQKSKDREKLGLVRVQSEGFKNQKRKEISTFTTKRKDFTGSTGNPTRTSEGTAYKPVAVPRKGRNRLGEQIARQSDAYKGNGLVKSDYAKRKDARKKSKQISKYRGDLLVTKQPKGAHPSSAYRGGKVKNSYQQKEKYRKRMTRRIGKNKDGQQPKFLRKKNQEEKPTYDSRESEIWNKSRSN